MNEVVNKFLLAGDKLMPEIYLKKTGFTYCACGPFTKNKERTQKLKEIGDTTRIYNNELDKVRFQHDMACDDFKDLAGRIASDKILRNKAFNIAKNPNYDGYQRRLASMVYEFFDKNSTGSGIDNNNNDNNNNNNDTDNINNEMKQNMQLAQELHKSITRKF